MPDGALRRAISRRDALRLGGTLIGGAAALGSLPILASAAAPAAPSLRRPGSLPFPGRPVGVPQPDLAPELAQIDHIVIVMMENHSFDNYFGMLPWHVPALRGRVDGFPALGPDGIPTATQTDAHGDIFRAFPLPSACQQTAHGPSQSWDASHQAFDGGRGDGFLIGSGEIAVGYWDEATIPFYYSLASTFPVCDRYFSSTLCQTYPNRVFLMAGTAAGLTSTDTPPPAVSPANGHIFNTLESHGITWQDYFTDLPTPGLFGIPYATTKAGTHMIPGGSVEGTIANFKTACGLGQLASVVFVESDYQYASEENPQDITAGQHFVAGIVDALMSSPSWQRSLLIFTYDEHGGYYDHVIPPPTLNPGDGSHPNLPQNRWYGDDYTRLGFRVPTVIVSPWAKAGYTSHTVFDHTSILATIQRKWNLPALTYRDANANHLGDCLVSSGLAPFGQPPALAPAQPTSQATSLLCTTSTDGAGTFPPKVGAVAGSGGPSTGPGGNRLPATAATRAGGTPNSAGSQPSTVAPIAAVVVAGLIAHLKAGRHSEPPADAAPD